MNSPLKQRLLLIRWWLHHMNGRQLRRWLYQVTRPSSYPYISGDGFRNLAKHVYDETNQHISPGSVRDGDIIFVATDYIRKFFEVVDPTIISSYKLITHNSIVPVDKSLVALLPGKVLIWFAKNNTFFHDRVVPIPLGLENLRHYNVGVPQEYSAVRGYSGPRKNRILAGFTIATNPGERQLAYVKASGAPCVVRLAARLSQGDYLRTLVTYKFLLAPSGSGLDTNRMWEAMYLGVVPIVKESVAMRSFEQRGLPLWIMRDWDQLSSITEHELERRYEKLRNGFGSPALFMDYWRGLIRRQDAANEQAEPRNARPSRQP